MKLFSFWWNFTNRHAYLILMSVFIVWCALGVFPLACYETDSLQLILGCDYAYSHGLEFPPVISYAYYMQPLTIIMVVALKHLMPILTCEQIYCLVTAVSSLIFLIGCVEFARHVTNGRRVNVLIAAMLLPEMYAIAMYPNSAIPAAACFVWAMICLTKERYWTAGLLMCAAPLLRADVMIAYPAILPLFLFEGKTSKKSIILSIVYAASVVTVDIFFFRLLKADFFSSANSYEAWNGIITLTQNMMSIFGFYSLPYLLLLPLGICRLCSQRMWRELFLVLLPILLLHFFFRKMGCASKHYLYIAPFVIIAGVRALSWICRTLSNRRLLRYAVVVCVIGYYTVSVRLWVPNPNLSYTYEDRRYNEGLVLDICSVSFSSSGAALSLGIGAGQYVATADELCLASGHIFYPWYIHSLKSELKTDCENQKIAIETFPSSSNIIACSWATWAPIASMCLTEGQDVYYDSDKRLLTIQDKDRRLSVWLVDRGWEEQWQFVNDVKAFCQSLPAEEMKYILVPTISFRLESYLKQFESESRIEKITDGLYEIKESRTE